MDKQENRSDGYTIVEQITDTLMLVRGTDGLSLTDGKISMRGDFTAKMSRLKKNNLEGELLVKAARLKKAGENNPPILLDATAGMGEDSLLLAAAGFHVEMYEYDPVIAALLEDTLKRAAEVPEIAAIAGRMHLHNESSITAMQRIGTYAQSRKHTEADTAVTEQTDAVRQTDVVRQTDAVQQTDVVRQTDAVRQTDTIRQTDICIPDVILLDPMFPERQKSALIKKKFQLLQQLESPCTDEKELLEAAIAVKPRKIVIKRPAKGPWLAGVKPDYSIDGKAIRYDILINLENR